MTSFLSLTCFILAIFLHFIFLKIFRTNLSGFHRKTWIFYWNNIGECLDLSVKL